MKITRIKLDTLHGRATGPLALLESIAPDEPNEIAQGYLFLETDEGATGFYGPVEVEPFALRRLAPHYLGCDPVRVERMWSDAYMACYRHGHKSHQVLTALSALDNAVWDLRGKVLGRPVYELLGGPTRETVRAYASCIAGSADPNRAREQARAVRQEGWSAQKWFLWGEPRWRADRESLEHHTRLARAIREGAGDDYDLMFDGVMTWHLNYALRLCRRLAELEPTWVEEAVGSNQIEGFRRIKGETGVPLATGEHVYTRWEAQAYLDAGVLDFLQCDPEWTGGVSELVRICAMASARGVQVVPHGHHVTSALHVVASQPQWVCPMMETLAHFAMHRQFFHAEPLAIDGGRVRLPAGPGMGVALEDAKIEKRETTVVCSK